MLGNVVKHRWMGTIALSIIGFAFGANVDPAADKTDAEEKDTYPMAVCVVSGEKLGEMGEPAVIDYKGREVRFCCSACDKTFREDPETYLKKLDEAAAAATQPTTQPADANHHEHGEDSEHDDHDHGDHSH